MTAPLPRKLAAILYADVVGFSRMASEDEDETHRRLKESLSQIATQVELFRGRVVNYSGDAVLAMFDAAVDAVTCATAIQNVMTELYQDVPSEQKIQFRIGVNLGDVIEDDGDIFGDGVNIAARLESLSEPGGICVSDAVRTAIGQKLELDYENLGAQKVKNIEESVLVYKVTMAGKNGSIRTSSDYVDAGLADIPSIAVLPFDNMSSDPEQEFFSDGITEDIITELSKEKDLFVIARNSTFVYKGQSIDVRQVAEELSVKFVLEGSVRKAGNRIRLNAQLIEAGNNRHVWAERYDHALEDVFEVQDELTSTIASTLLQKFRYTETERALRKTPDNLDAYDHYLRAFGLLLKLNKEDCTEAIGEARKALGIEPDYARALMVLAWAHAYRTWSGWSDDLESDLAACRDAAFRSVECDEGDFWGHGAIAFAELFSGNHERALNAINRAVDLSPNNADSYAMRAIILNTIGEPEQALKEINWAIQLNPGHPSWYLTGIGRAYYLLGNYEKAIPYVERLVNAGEDILVWQALLIACYQGAGRKTDARVQVEALLKSRPDIRSTEIVSLVPLREEKVITQYKEFLMAAGLPE